MTASPLTIEQEWPLTIERGGQEWTLVLVRDYGKVRADTHHHEGSEASPRQKPFLSARNCDWHEVATEEALEPILEKLCEDWRKAFDLEHRKYEYSQSQRKVLATDLVALADGKPVITDLASAVEHKMTQMAKAYQELIQGWQKYSSANFDASVNPTEAALAALEAARSEMNILCSNEG